MTSTEAPIQISDRAWKALEGAYDLQVHVGPDVIPRRIDDIDCAREFLAHGMKGFVLKSHYIQTGERAQVVTKAVPGSRVVGAARRCMERIARHGMILATGHLGRREIFALVRTAREMGLKKVVVTHAEFPSQNLTGDEQRELAGLGAIIEHCFTTTYTAKATWEATFDNV